MRASTTLFVMLSKCRQSKIRESYLNVPLYIQKGNPLIFVKFIYQKRIFFLLTLLLLKLIQLPLFFIFQLLTYIYVFLSKLVLSIVATRIFRAYTAKSYEYAEVYEDEDL